MQLPQFQVHAAIEETHWWFRARRRIVQGLIHELLPPNTGKKILDVGCGTGGMTAYLSGDYAMTGIDPAEEAISFARTRFPQCTFMRGYAPDDVRKECSEADMVLLLEVLEHVEHDRDFVQDLIASMKPGAFLMMFAPADMSLWGPHDRGFEHFRRYDSADELRRTWSGAQVEELLVSYCNTRLYPVAKTARILARLKGSAWGPGNTDLATPPGPANTILEWAFRGELTRLKKALHRQGRPFSHGVSLMAILRKT
jgi:SAM-dependent methyltransferase